MSVVIARMTMLDYPEVIQLWGQTPGIGLSQADEPERIAAYLERNPGMSFTARKEGELVGAALAGHDGRRGYLHHLAVRTDRRGQGIGRALVEHCLESLRQAGIDKCHLFVFHSNQEGIAFWKYLGWKERVEIVLMSANL
jgi:N-acetylglutamate synthase